MHVSPRWAATAAAAAAVGALTAGCGSSSSSTAAAPAPSASGTLTAGDRNYLDINERGNLTEIRATQVVDEMITYQPAVQLADLTAKAHTTVMAKAKTVAAAYRYTLPSTLDPQQQMGLAAIRTSPQRTAAYFKLSIVGHQQSITATKQEIATTKNAQVKAFAQYYLPIAESHLAMSQADLKALMAQQGAAGSTNPAAPTPTASSS